LATETTRKAKHPGPAKTSARRTAAAKKGARKRKEPTKEKLIQTANALTLRAWEQTYAKRDRFGKFD
jgi:hypothetical protein